MNELQKLHTMVWRFRGVMEPFWATPEPVDCLRYAFCEAAEAMDAWLRQQRPNDSRNNQRQPDVLDELADCAIMLLSAVPFWELVTCPNPGQDEFSLDSICSVVARAMRYPNLWFTLVAANAISSYPGMNLEERVIDRLSRIADKHAPEETRVQAIDLLYG